MLDRARVEVVGKKMKRCRRKGRRHDCGPSWNWVGPHLAEVQHRPYSCIYAHPVDGKQLLITYPAAKLGRSLVLHTGIDDFENRKRAKAKVRMQIFVGAELLQSVRHENDWPWTRSKIDTSKYAGQTGKVRFEVSSERAYARTFCFWAEARK